MQALSCDFLCLQDTQSKRTPRGKPVPISILALLLVFHAVTPERSSFRKNPTYYILCMFRPSYTWRRIIMWYCLWNEWSQMSVLRYDSVNVIFIGRVNAIHQECDIRENTNVVQFVVRSSLWFVAWCSFFLIFFIIKQFWTESAKGLRWLLYIMVTCIGFLNACTRQSHHLPQNPTTREPCLSVLFCLSCTSHQGSSTADHRVGHRFRSL